MNNLKSLLLVASLSFATFSAYSQATVTSTSIEKENRNAVMVAIDQPVNITENALEQRLKHSGLSGKTRNNATSYKAVTLSEIAPEKVDIYTKVEPGQNKNTSIVYMAVSKGYNNFTNSEGDSMITEHIKTFLNSFVKDASAFSADLNVASQLDEVNSLQKDYDNLMDDLKALEAKKADIESSIANKTKDIQAKKEDLDQKKQALEDLKTKRAGLDDTLKH
ncbi:MAG: hypothetical protein H0W62_09865 [Chitinophagales bacterium]|nr:hypothetical protein [Chitinophagales bacterium]